MDPVVVILHTIDVPEMKTERKHWLKKNEEKWKVEQKNRYYEKNKEKNNKASRARVGAFLHACEYRREKALEWNGKQKARSTRKCSTCLNEMSGTTDSAGLIDNLVDSSERCYPRRESISRCLINRGAPGEDLCRTNKYTRDRQQNVVQRSEFLHRLDARADELTCTRTLRFVSQRDLAYLSLAVRASREWVVNLHGWRLTGSTMLELVETTSI